MSETKFTNTLYTNDNLFILIGLNSNSIDLIYLNPPFNSKRFYSAPIGKGGGDYYENYQLLCGACNRIKGDRPMEYLRLKIKTREEMLGELIQFGE